MFWLLLNYELLACQWNIFCKFFADLMTVLDRNVDELSGGELQRFACAVVCIQKADMYVTSFEPVELYSIIKRYS